MIVKCMKDFYIQLLTIIFFLFLKKKNIIFLVFVYIFKSINPIGFIK